VLCGPVAQLFVRMSWLIPHTNNHPVWRFWTSSMPFFPTDETQDFKVFPRRCRRRRSLRSVR
jgi:hypothetical protein